VRSLTKHFFLEEFTRTSTGLPNEPPESAISRMVLLCVTILEPIREHFKGRKLIVNSGYRCPAVNKKVGGSTRSLHLYEKGLAAVDFHIEDVPVQDVFDWIRLESKLPFDKVILERGVDNNSEADDCVHIQTTFETQPRRLAFTGGTHGRSKYTPAEVR